MKIPITRTELYGTPDSAWSIFCRRIKERAAEYTPVQETAFLCYTYYTEIYDYRDWGGTDLLGEREIDAIEEREWYHGHLDFFDYCEANSIDTDELVQALEKLGVPEFAENFLSALDKRPEENSFDADVWFVEHDEALLGAIREYWRSNLEEFYEIIEENYSMRPPKDGFWVAIFIAGFVGIMMIIASLTNPDPAESLRFLVVSICTLLSLGLILFFYAMRWKMTILGDKITIRYLILFKKRINFGEISNMKWLKKGLVFYVRGKRIFFLSKEIKKYSMFCTQLSVDRKQTDEPEMFTVRRSNAKKIEGIMWPLAFVCFLVWSLSRKVNPAGIIEITILSLPIPAALIYTIHCLRWKITVYESYIRVRSMLSDEKEYNITDITKVDLKKSKVIFFTADGKSFNMKYGEGYPEMAQKLQNEGIPFYKDGKLL